MPTRRARVADAARHDCVGSDFNPKYSGGDHFSNPRPILSVRVVFKKEFAVALALALVSGAPALAHQLVWTRRLVEVLGANADAFSKVVGAFFAGLAVGAWIASRRSRTRVSFWRRVALAEAVVALLALPILSSYAEFVRDVHRSGKSLLPPRLRSAHDAGQYFLTLEVAAKLKSPAFANLHAQAADRTPASLRDDRQADWRQWPMRLKPRPAQ